ncbi:hypothetical protein BGZ94_006722 [Podila epigama]|nr:hypothetical protein BGZ94_006722 [Podila epigama]
MVHVQGTTPNERNSPVSRQRSSRNSSRGGNMSENTRRRNTDNLYDHIAWGFIPLSMRPQSSATISTRPTAEDLVDNRLVDSPHQTTSLSSSSSSSSSPSSLPLSTELKDISMTSVGNQLAMDEWTSPSPSRKRLSSVASPSDTNGAAAKRQVISDRPFPRRPFIEDNPFSVPENTEAPSTNLNFLFKPFRSQQFVGTTRLPDPASPTTSRMGYARSRRSSWVPAFFDQPISPCASTLSPTTPTHRRISQLDRNSSRCETFPGLVRTDGAQFTTMGHLGRKTPPLGDPPIGQTESPALIKSPDGDVRDINLRTSSSDFRTPTRPPRPSKGPQHLFLTEISPNGEPTLPLVPTCLSNETSPATPRSHLTFSRETSDTEEQPQVGEDEQNLSIAWSPSNETPRKNVKDKAKVMDKANQMHVLRKLRGFPVNADMGSDMSGDEEDSHQGPLTTSPLAHRAPTTPTLFQHTLSRMSGRLSTTTTPTKNVGDISEWSAAFETPPRKETLTKSRGANGNNLTVLEQLQGKPTILVMPTTLAMPPNERRGSTDSQDGSFYSATSLMDDAERDCRSPLARERGGDSTQDGAISDQDPLPEEETSSPVLSPQQSQDKAHENVDIPVDENLQLSDVVQSPILPKSQVMDVHESSDDLFAGMSSSAFQSVFSSSKSTDGDGRTGSQMHLKSQRSGGARSQLERKRTPRTPKGDSFRSKTQRRPSNPFQTLSQEMDGLQLEPWTLSSAGSDPAMDDAFNFVKQEQIEDAPGEPEEDDFADLGVIHIDDLQDFMISPAKPRCRSTLQDIRPVMTKEMDDRTKADETYETRDDATVVHQRSDTGFEFKATKVSEAAMSKFSDMFEEGDELEVSNSKEGLPQEFPPPVFGRFRVSDIGHYTAAAATAAITKGRVGSSYIGKGELDKPEDGSSMMHAESAPRTAEETVVPAVLPGFGRYRSGKGLEPLAPISKEAQARAARIFADDNDIDIAIAKGSDGTFVNDSKESMVDDHRNDGTNVTASVGMASKVPQVLPGFTTGRMKPAALLSREKLEKWSRFFDDDDESGTVDTQKGKSRADASRGNVPSRATIPTGAGAPVPVQPSLGGFSVASGKPLPKLSESALNKWASLFADDEDGPPSKEALDGSRPLEKSTQAPVIGFTSAKNSSKPFVPVPVSKAAQDCARSLLEMDDNEVASVPGPAPLSNVSVVDKAHRITSHAPAPALSSFARVGTAGTTRPVPGPIAGVGRMPLSSSSSSTLLAPSHPTVSNHMNNLMLKSLRSPMSRSSSALPGALRPMGRASNTQFKSPLMSRDSRSTKDTLQEGNDSKKGTVPLTGGGGMSLGGIVGRKQIGKRALHPNARSTVIPPTPQGHVAKVSAPVYRSLFNLEASGPRESISRLGPPQKMTRQELLDYGLPQHVIDMDLKSAATFRFSDPAWGNVEAFKDLVARGANQESLSQAWVSNHYKLIVWKLACYCRSWPSDFPVKDSFTPTAVMAQLCYRYEREVNRAERPALRKVTEGDESVGRHMVLCIASIEQDAKGTVQSVTVTDGWYVVPAMLDGHLKRAVQRGRLAVGTKVHVCQATMQGGENGGVAILERPNAISIGLHSNNTRLARWDAKLGFQKQPLQWTTRLRNIMPEGGLVPGLDVVVLRRYPVVFLETLENDVKVRRSAREEEQAQEAHQTKVEKQFQEIVAQVEKEMMGPGRMDENFVNREEIEQEVQKRMSEVVNKMKRDVLPMFMVRVGNCFNDGSKHQEALITFWKADQPGIQEGHRVRLTCLKATKQSREPGMEEMIHLSSTRSTVLCPAPSMEPEALFSTAYQPREITMCTDIMQLHLGAEMDLAVIVLAMSETLVHSFKRYLVVTDVSRRLILVEYHVATFTGGYSSLTTTAAKQQAQLPPFWIKIGSKVLLANARFKAYDHKLDVEVVVCPLSYSHATVVVASNTSMSGRGTHGWPAYAQQSLQDLNDMTAASDTRCQQRDGLNGVVADDGDDDDDDKDETIPELMGRANAIVMRMQPLL